ncbi:MAG: hypothetical protein JW941_03210 [Candidatus Coatesbacteria bacterium]|nr:hypothetical protein [Candidatus Coatesbacteria bacterium]
MARTLVTCVVPALVLFAACATPVFSGEGIEGSLTETSDCLFIQNEHGLEQAELAALLSELSEKGIELIQRRGLSHTAPVYIPLGAGLNGATAQLRFVSALRNSEPPHKCYAHGESDGEYYWARCKSRMEGLQELPLIDLSSTGVECESELITPWFSDLEGSIH